MRVSQGRSTESGEVLSIDGGMQGRAPKVGMGPVLEEVLQDLAVVQRGAVIELKWCLVHTGRASSRPSG